MIEKEKNHDFLSSIEILFVESAHLFLYQNIQHLEDLLENINNTPQNTENINDINRIKPQFLKNMSKYYRQTIFTTKLNSLDINCLFNKQNQNYEGFFHLDEYYSGILQYFIQYNLQATFHRINCLSILKAHDTKFDYFTKTVKHLF